MFMAVPWLCGTIITVQLSPKAKLKGLSVETDNGSMAHVHICNYVHPKFHDITYHCCVG